jgi:hypothetical protein
MIVECLGLPGSRKSTLSREVATQGIAVAPMRTPLASRIALSTFFSIVYPRAAWRLLRVTFDSRTGGVTMLRYKLGLLSSSLASVIRAKRAGNMLVDEGIMQRVLASFERKLSAAEADSIIMSLKHALGAVLLFRGGNMDRFFSYDDAHDSPRVRLGEAYLTQWIEAMKANLATLEGALERAGISVSRCDMIDAPHEAVQAATRLFSR